MRSGAHPQGHEAFRTVGNPVGLLHGDPPQFCLKLPVESRSPTGMKGFHMVGNTSAKIKTAPGGG